MVYQFSWISEVAIIFVSLTRLRRKQRHKQSMNGMFNRFSKLTIMESIINLRDSIKSLPYKQLKRYLTQVLVTVEERGHASMKYFSYSFMGYALLRCKLLTELLGQGARMSTYAKYGMLTSEMGLCHNFKPTTPTKKLYRAVATQLQIYTDHDDSQKNTNQ